MSSKQRRWLIDLYKVGDTIVGTKMKSANGSWHAHGCMDDWQDVDLGSHSSEKAAKEAVEKWVEDNLDG